MSDSELTDWYRRLRTVAQYGLTYSKDPYDLERFREVLAISEELALRLTQEPGPRVSEALRLELGPPSPKLDARAAVFRDDRVLLVRETADGNWSLPGGWIDLGEAPGDAAAREVREESGYECAPRKLIAVVDWGRHSPVPQLFHVYKLLFWCELLGGEPKPSLETSESGFFGLDDLPPLSLTRVSEAMIQLAFRHRAAPELPTEFD
ncbi:MAG: NUDIX domain-containing protein [Myxococcales bacterium]|nr:MAG: NUDIX domain-containing protein [Myxococcales bacterium]